MIILPATEGGEALLARRQAGAPDVRRGPVAELLAGVSPDTAVLPGQQVRGLLTELPDRLKAAERLSVARFAHEDRLAVDPAGLHVVVGAGNPAPTAAVDPDVLRALLEVMDPDRVVADFDVLAGMSGPVRVLDRVVVPGPAGHAVDPDWAEPGYAVPDDAELARAVFARLDSGEVLNLRAGGFRRRRAVAAGPWRRVAAVGIVCALLGLGLAGAQARATARQADALEAQARALYTERTGQPAPARLSALARGAPSADAPPTQFLDLSQTLFRAVDATPGAQVERLSYEPGEARLRLRLLYTDFDAAAALETAVAQAGGTLTTGGVREQNGVFIGDAALAADGSS